MPYLRGKGPELEGCLFCVVAGWEDARAHILYRGAHNFVILNLYPYSNGHMMVVPYEHVARFELLDDPVLLEMMQLVQLCQRVLAEVYDPAGFNVGLNQGQAAGAGVAEHLHMHVVPRWPGDANYMTVVGQTRVIPEWIDETYATFRPYFDAYAAGR